MLFNLTPEQRVPVKLVRNLVLAELIIHLLYILLALPPILFPLHKASNYRIPSGPEELLRVADEFRTDATHPLRKIKMPPSANIFNRPIYAVEHRADYLGTRPHSDTEADLNAIVKACRGTYDDNEKIRDIGACLKYLAEKEDMYYFLPKPEQRASAQDPKDAEFASADGLSNNSSAYPAYEPPNERLAGTCSGPIIPYHTYWKGVVTWRVEAFIKSYLFTQNLACARLWLWLDADENPDVVNATLTSTLFVRFLPLVERGDIIVREWKFPTHVAIPEDAPNRAFDLEYLDIETNESGQRHVRVPQKTMPFQAAALSDAVRFVILHLFGGVYLDIDMLLLRDVRPLLLPKQHNWAETWGTSLDPGDYNTAVLSLTANSALSTYFLLGSIRMGVHFHPRAIGRMAVEDGRDRELLKFNDGLFDPIWTVLEGYKGECTVPCLRQLDDAFRAHRFDGEWDSYTGERLKPILNSIGEKIDYPTTLFDINDGSAVSVLAGILADINTNDTMATLAALKETGVIAKYREEDERDSAKNRTLQNFYRGAWAYHVHNQWSNSPEPWSWLDTLQQAHNRFFSRSDTNPYGEIWEGPKVIAYDFFPSELGLTYMS